MLTPVSLGKTGLSVSPLCLGTMNLGKPGQGNQGDFALDFSKARELIKAAIDQGIFYFDTADVYGQGASEQTVGKCLRELLPRDEYVLATKVAHAMGPGANQGGLSRKHIMEGVDASLQRLGLDYVDQLIIHRHPHGLAGHACVPIEETLEALHDVVRAGKALYLGASTMFAWQFSQLQLTAKMHGWTPFISMQNHYNLIYREEEREMNAYCASAGIALTPWSPLARGVLAGSYHGDFTQGKSKRSQSNDRLRSQRLYQSQQVFEIVQRVMTVAKKYGKSPAQISLAWLLNKAEIVAPVVGASSISQLIELVGAVDIKLEVDDVDYLEALYQPVANLLSVGVS